MAYFFFFFFFFTFFSLLQWAPVDPPLVGISCLEVLVDFMISFQIRTPLTQRVLKSKYPHVKLTLDAQASQNYFPTREEFTTLPPPLFAECSSTWLHTLDHLLPVVPLVPFGRVSQRTLRNFSYDNPVPSWPARPILLSGSAASDYLATLMKPRARTLKYRVLVPRRAPLTLPPSLTNCI